MNSYQAPQFDMLSKVVLPRGFAGVNAFAFFPRVSMFPRQPTHAYPFLVVTRGTC